MIDILEKIEQLKSIAKMVDDGTPRYQIVDKCNEIINEDQKKVDGQMRRAKKKLSSTMSPVKHLAWIRGKRQN